MSKTNRFKEKSGRQNHKLAELTSKVIVSRSTAPTTTKLLMEGLDRNGSYALVTVEYESVTTEYERRRV